MVDFLKSHREETKRRAALGEYSAEKRRAWDRIKATVDWETFSIWYTEIIANTPYWQFRRQRYRDSKTGEAGLIIVAKRSDRTEWEPLESFLPAYGVMGDIV